MIMPSISEPRTTTLTDCTGCICSLWPVGFVGRTRAHSTFAALEADAMPETTDPTVETRAPSTRLKRRDLLKTGAAATLALAGAASLPTAAPASQDVTSQTPGSTNIVHSAAPP